MLSQRKREFPHQSIRGKEEKKAYRGAAFASSGVKEGGPSDH